MIHNVRPLASEDYDERTVSSKGSVFKLSAVPSMKSKLTKANVERLSSAKVSVRPQSSSSRSNKASLVVSKR